MICFGNVPANSVLPIFFDSFAGASGASSTISGLAVTDIEVYKGTSMTQRSSDNGYTLLDTDGIDLDGITGINGFSIDLSDNTDAGFYAAGSFYNVVVSAITVDSQTVNFIAATFRIVAAEGTAGVPVADAVRWNNLATVALPLAPTTAGRTLDVSAGGEAGIDWANIGSPTTAQTLSGTSTKALEPTTAGRTLDVTATGEAGIDWANIGSPSTVVGLSGTTVKTATDVETDTQDIQSRLPAALTAGGNMKADALALSGDTTAADNAESFFDGTGYAGTNNVIPLVTTATNLTNAPTGGDFTATMKTSLNAATPAVSVSAGGIAAASFAAGAIDAAAIASDADTEIATAVWASATRTLTGSQGIKKNTAKAGFLFAMTDSTTHAPATGLTVTATRSLDGAAFGACANAVVEVSAGWYKIDLAAGDLNGDTVALKFTAPGADQLNIALVTSP